MGTVHFIAGPVGAGKSTYASALARDRNALVFSTDRWMKELFLPDLEGPPKGQWMFERVERCERAIRRTAAEALRLGIEVVLDLGFMRVEHRARYLSWAVDLGVAHFLHALDADPAVRRERVLRRNADRSETRSFDIDEETFAWAESWYEPVGAFESLHLVRVRMEGPIFGLHLISK